MIKSSRLWIHPSIIWTIIKNTPTLDPLVILLNSKLYYIENKENHKIVSFATVKKWSDCIEIGTVYTNPQHRGKRLAGKIISKIKKDYGTIWLLCKKELIKYYKKQSFKVINKAENSIGKRQRLFNDTLGKILKYQLVVMMNKKV